MSTYFPSSKTIAPRWYLVDATDEVLGRLAARVAQLLRGKDSAHFTPFLETGEHVVVINAEKIRVTGRKLDQKEYHHFTGSPGGLKTTSLRALLAKHPERIIREAVEGMLPKNKHGRHLGANLKVYTGAAHPHAAQQPQPIQLTKPARSAPAKAAQA